MKAAADLLSTYGLFVKPRELTDEEAMCGLMLNRKRVSALRSIDTLRGYAAAHDREALMVLLNDADASPMTLKRVAVEGSLKQ